MAIQVTSRPTPQVGAFSVSEASTARVEVIMARYPEDRKASGIIPLLDRRIVTKRYGRAILDTLPRYQFDIER